MFGLILPHISASEGQQICERLLDSFGEKTGETGGSRVQVFFSLVELSTEDDESETDFFGRANLELASVMESGEYRTVSVPDGQ